MGRVDGKVTVISGGASGIGAATARAILREGGTAWITDLNDEAGQALAAELGERARYRHLDATSLDDWNATVDAIEQQDGRLDVLVHSAGGGVIGDVEGTTLQQWRFVQALNVESVFLGSQAALPLLRKSGAGSVVIVSSVAGLVGDPNMAAYCAAKGAVRMLAKSMALACARRGGGIRVNSIHPSFIDTPLVAGLIDGSGDPDGMRKTLEKAAPLRRMGQAEEVADLILYLGSDESKFVTGAELAIDGGLTAR